MVFDFSFSSNQIDSRPWNSRSCLLLQGMLSRTYKLFLDLLPYSGIFNIRSTAQETGVKTPDTEPRRSERLTKGETDDYTLLALLQVKERVAAKAAKAEVKAEVKAEAKAAKAEVKAEAKAAKAEAKAAKVKTPTPKKEVITEDEAQLDKDIVDMDGEIDSRNRKTTRGYG